MNLKAMMKIYVTTLLIFFRACVFFARARLKIFYILKYIVVNVNKLLTFIFIILRIIFIIFAAVLTIKTTDYD